MTANGHRILGLLILVVGTVCLAAWLLTRDGEKSTSEMVAPLPAPESPARKAPEPTPREGTKIWRPANGIHFPEKLVDRKTHQVKIKNEKGEWIDDPTRQWFRWTTSLDEAHEAKVMIAVEAAVGEYTRNETNPGTTSDYRNSELERIFTERWEKEVKAGGASGLPTREDAERLSIYPGTPLAYAPQAGFETEDYWVTSVRGRFDFGLFLAGYAIRKSDGRAFVWKLAGEDCVLIRERLAKQEMSD